LKGSRRIKEGKENFLHLTNHFPPLAYIKAKTYFGFLGEEGKSIERIIQCDG